MGKSNGCLLVRDRRKTDRFMLGSLIAVTCSIEDRDVFSAELIDVSRGGCKLRLSLDDQKISVSSSTLVRARFCFSDDICLELPLSIVSFEEFTEDGLRLARLGCSLERAQAGIEDYARLIEFLTSYEVRACA